MNIDFGKAFDNGASEEEILQTMRETIEKQKSEYEAQIHAAAEEHARKQIEKEKTEDKEDLKREGRVHLVNALICYSHAFDLLDEKGWTQEDIDKVEAMIKKVEDMVPLYIKLIEMRQGMNEDLDLDEDNLGDIFFGLF